MSKKYPQGKLLSTALNQVFDPELSSWLLAELAENRDKNIGPNKVSESCLCYILKNIADNVCITSFMTALSHRHCLACPMACPHKLLSDNKHFMLKQSAMLSSSMATAISGKGIVQSQWPGISCTPCAMSPVALCYNSADWNVIMAAANGGVKQSSLLGHNISRNATRLLCPW